MRMVMAFRSAIGIKITRSLFSTSRGKNSHCSIFKTSNCMKEIPCTTSTAPTK